MPSVAFVVETIENRLRNGDYRVRAFPANRRLAEDLGVSRQTVRKAVADLVARGRLEQTPKGRISTAARDRSAVRHLAIVTPAYPEAILIHLYNAIHSAIQGERWEVKAVHYSHWHDPLISDALRGMDGVFFLPFAEDFPADVVRLLQSAGKVIVTERDLSAQGLPSLLIQPPSFVGKLLQQCGCAERGPVACLSTQPMDHAIQSRIDHWRQWTAMHGVEGPLLNHPVMATRSAAEHAREVMLELLRDGSLKGVGTLFCTTAAAAYGAMRAMADRGMRPGIDLSVCSADSGFGSAQLYIPSLTCLHHPPLDPFVRLCLGWIASEGKAWPGTLLMQPTEVPVFLGESTARSTCDLSSIAIPSFPAPAMPLRDPHAVPRTAAVAPL